MTAEDMPDGSRAHEYVFDVKLAATIRLIAANERAAWDAVEKHLDGADLMPLFHAFETLTRVKEASLHIDDATGPLLLTVDGEEAYST